MSGRRELRRRIDSLREIGELLGAMRALAMVETRRIESFISAQRGARAIVEATLADALADQPAMWPVAPPAADVLCVIGAERGFCGDFNRRLCEAAAAGPHDAPPLAARVLVGTRLAEAWRGEAAHTVAGATTADEVPAVLAALLATLGPLLAPGVGAVLLHTRDGELVRQRLLPVPQPATRAALRSHPVMLTLTPRAFHAALFDQFLYTALSGGLYDALLAENRQRLAHMERARGRIDETLETLGRRQNRLRQAEITEQIELNWVVGDW